MLNNVVLMGRITHSPELKNTQSGTSVLSFTIAVDRRFQQKGEEKQTDFINCVAWRHTAEFISRNFNKGDAIAVTGEIQTRKYEVDGNKRTATEIVVNNASFCGGKAKQEDNDDDYADRLFMRVKDIDDDLPF